MTDFLAHRLAFGGFALEPLTPAAEDFLTEYEWEDSTFRHPDGCMTGLPESAVGFEPFLDADIVEELRERGLTSKAAAV
jgi:hypothetical protein